LRRLRRDMAATQNTERGRRGALPGCGGWRQRAWGEERVRVRASLSLLWRGGRVGETRGESENKKPSLPPQKKRARRAPPPRVQPHAHTLAHTHTHTTMSAPVAAPPAAATTPLAQLQNAGDGGARPPSSSGRKDGSGRVTQKRAFDLMMKCVCRGGGERGRGGRGGRVFPLNARATFCFFRVRRPPPHTTLTLLPSLPTPSHRSPHDGMDVATPAKGEREGRGERGGRRHTRAASPFRPMSPPTPPPPHPIH
jgi:hypothetical protein